MIEGVRRTLFVLELTRRLGQITVSVLATQPDWNKASACRYLRDICDAGWLERLSADGRPRYVLGRRAIDFGVDLRF